MKTNTRNRVGRPRKYKTDEERREAIKASKRKYRLSIEGKATEERYRSSTKGREATKRYYYSEKGKTARQNYKKSGKKAEKALEYYCTKKGKATARKGQKKFLQTLKGRMSDARHHAIRHRQFSDPQIFLNDFKFDSDAHHIDYHHMVYIPRNIHKIFRHDLSKPSKNLDIVNSVAYAEVYFYNEFKQKETK